MVPSCGKTVSTAAQYRLGTSYYCEGIANRLIPGRDGSGCYTELELIGIRDIHLPNLLENDPRFLPSYYFILSC